MLPPAPTLAPSQGNIQVIPEPGGKRNVPSSPEFSNVPREVGKGKVLHKLKPNKSGRTYGNIGISREITIYLKGKEDWSK